MGFQGKVAVLCGVAALLVVGTSAEVLFSIDGPVDPIKGKVVGTTKVVDEMHIEFDIDLHSVPSSGWYNVFRVGAGDYIPSLWIHEQADNDGGQYEGWNLYFGGSNQDTSLGDEPLVAGNSYHFEMEWTQSHIVVQINGNTVWDKAAHTHSTSDEETVYMSALWDNAADVTIRNFVISTDLSCWVTGYECESYEVCWDDGECGPHERQECDAVDIEELKSEVQDLKDLIHDLKDQDLKDQDLKRRIFTDSMKWVLTGKDLAIIALLAVNLLIISTLFVVCRRGSGGKYVFEQ